jgi:hypothetical protein
MCLPIRIYIVISVILATCALQACKHPLAIVGEGDIVDANNSGHGCTLEQFQAQDTACTENEVSGDYFVNYKAQPRPGWRFVRWDGPCSTQSDFQHCRFDIPQDKVAWWDETQGDTDIVPSTAVFQPITGKTGFLVDTAVAGLAYETPSQQGVTGLDGSFQYQQGETVRFMLGNTLIGEVTGRNQVTPFELAASAVITGTLDITRALDNPRNAFHTVVNIGVLLQSVDDDGDPGNGIVIRAGVAELFRRVSLDVSQPWEIFQADPGLRQALARANSKGRFSRVHGRIRPAMAMQHLYDTLGINARTSAVTLQQRREDGALAPVEASQYDVNGNLTLREQDHEGDGTANAIQRWDYDALGNTVRYEWEESDGEGIERLQYDTNGNTTRHEWDWGWDEDHAIDEFESWEYDARGNLTRHEQGYYTDNGSPRLEGVDSYEYDAKDKLIRETSEDEGSPDRIISYQYDVYGNLTREERDGDGDGSPELISTWQYQYDGDGRPTRGELDADNDGAPNRIDSYQYDASGNLVEQALDFNVDGKPDMFWTWQYDANGNLTLHKEERGPQRKLRTMEAWRYDASGNLTLYERDENGDGIAEVSESWQYDENGSPTRHEQDYDGDGTADEIDSWQYQYGYDGNGNLAWRERYDTGGTVTEIITYTYDAGHQLAGEQRWTREVGREVHDWQYDPAGKLVYERVDERADGTINQSVIYEYDSSGNLASQEEDADGDGTVDFNERYQYDGRGRVTQRYWDEIGDGDPGNTNAWAYLYDASGRVTRKSLDAQNDGTADLIESWTYDARGNTTRYQWRCLAADWFVCMFPVGYDSDHFFPGGYDEDDGYGYGFSAPEGEQITNYQYDVNNKLISKEVIIDSDSDAIADETKRYQYDTDGNRTRYEQDYDGDGIADRTESWQYDARGNVTRHEWDYRDGTPTEFESWTYQYDANGKLTREDRYHSDGMLIARVSYEYDSDGNLIRQSITERQNNVGDLEITEVRDFEESGWGHIFSQDP